MIETRKINQIVVHSSATPPSMCIGLAQIRDWHVNGNGWSDVGYHFIIRRNGKIESGRPLKRAGAHAMGHNDDSIGVCLVGGVDEDMKPDMNFTRHQLESLKCLNTGLVTALEITNKTCGHRDLPNTNTACPSFNVGAFLYG